MCHLKLLIVASLGNLQVVLFRRQPNLLHLLTMQWCRLLLYLLHKIKRCMAPEVPLLCERDATQHINAWWGLDKDLVLHISLLLCSLLGFIILICYRQISNSSLHNFLLLIDFILIAFAVCQLMKFSVPSFGPYKLHLACTVLSLCTNHHLLLPVVFWDISQVTVACGIINVTCQLRVACVPSLIAELIHKCSV